MARSWVCLGVAVLAFCAPASALAGWVRSRVPNSDGSYCATCSQIFWCNDRAITYAIHEGGSDDTAALESVTAAQQSFAAWSAPACTDLRFIDGGTTPRYDIGYSQGDADNLSLVVWREQSCAKATPAGHECFEAGGCNNLYNCWEGSLQTIALTTTTFNNKTGEIFDADIEFNGLGFVFSTVDGPACSNPPPRPALNCVATDVRNTLTHEVGHVVGLDHPDLSSEPGIDHANDRDVTMYSSASLGEVNKRTLHQDDIDGLCEIYPKGLKSQQCFKADEVKGVGCDCSAAGASWGGLGAALAALAALWRRRRS